MFNNAKSIIINNKEVKTIKNKNGGILYEKPITKKSSSLSIDLPLNLIYSDEFNITGTLTNLQDEEMLSGQTVSLKVGDTIVDSATTDSNGVVSFTQTPVTMGNHSFQLIYDGDSNFNASTSSIVTRTIGKETSVINVSSPMLNSSMFVGEPVEIIGTLTDDDGSNIDRANIVVSENGASLGGGGATRNGAFSIPITFSNEGTHTISIQFMGNDNYSASSVILTIIVNNPLTITSDKSILSYYDNDVANLTVNYTKDGVPYNGGIFCSTFPDFFDGTNLYIPFEKGDENWGIAVTGTFDILNEDRTLYDTLTSSQEQRIKYEDGVVTKEEWMKDTSVISLPTKGFFLVPLQQLTYSVPTFTSLGGPSFCIEYISNGVLTIPYNSRGVGDVTFYFTLNDGTLLEETCELIDAKYYASNETINLAPRYNNDRNLFASDYQIQEGDKIHFRFKNITNHMLWGIGSTAGADFVFEQVGTTLKYWRNVLNNGSYNSPSYLATIENDYIFEYLKYDSTQWKVNIYIGDRYVDFWRCGNTIRKIRIDKWDDSNPSWNVEVFVL